MNKKLLVTIAAIVSMEVGTASAGTVNLGALTPLTGGDAGEGLDLSGDIIYAFNLGGTAQTVQGVPFVAAPITAPPGGITTTAKNAHNYGATVNYGTSANDTALENITTSVWYDRNWYFDLAVKEGQRYQLQLVLQEGYAPIQGDPSRNFDIWIETASPSTVKLAVDDLALGTDTTAAKGLVFTYSFTASDTSFLVALGDSPAGADTNCILTAVILEKLADASEPDADD